MLTNRGPREALFPAQTIASAVTVTGTVPNDPARLNRSRKNQNVSISQDSVEDSVAYDPVKTRLSEFEAEAEEPTKTQTLGR